MKYQYSQPPSTEEMDVVRKWVESWDVQKIKSINYKATSYGLKHVVERWSGVYIANASFIEAMIDLGFKEKRCQGTPNFFFNISSDVFKKDRAQIDGARHAVIS